MAKLLQTLIPILLLAAAATTARSQPIWPIWPTVLYFSYNFSDGSPPTDLTFQGDARILHQLGGGGTFLRLTDAKNEAVGRVLYTPPFNFGHTSFQTTFSFTISPIPDQTPADGIVFFIAPAGSTPPNGGAGGNFGVFESSGNGPAIFAAEFDTFVNEWDPNDRHIGIDIGSRESRITAPVGDAIVGKDVTATISYADKVISVAVSAGTETFEVSYEYDLSGYFTQQVQVGLSAATGGEVAAHDIHSWNFTAVTYTGPPNKSRKQLIRQFV